MRRGQDRLIPVPYPDDGPWWWHDIAMAHDRHTVDSPLVLDPMVGRPLDWQAYRKRAFRGQLLRIAEDTRHTPRNADFLI